MTAPNTPLRVNIAKLREVSGDLHDFVAGGFPTIPPPILMLDVDDAASVSFNLKSQALLDELRARLATVMESLTNFADDLDVAAERYTVAAEADT